MSTFLDGEDLSERLAFLVDQTDQLRQLYAERQSGTIERQGRGEAASSEPEPTSPASTIRPRALVIDDRMPLPDHDAGSNVILSHVRSLQRLGYDVTFAPANLRGDDAHLQTQGIACCLHPWYSSVEDVLKRHHDKYALVYMHRAKTAARYVALARDHQPRARLVFSIADLHHLPANLWADVEQRQEPPSASDQIRLMELTAAWQADAIITHSSVEADLLRKHITPDRVHLVPWSVPTRPTTVPFARRRGVAFVGNYGHASNVDAAMWLVDAVMPEVETCGCSAPCLLIGSDMPDSLRSLRRHNVDPIGYVRNLSAVFDRIRLTVAPLASGAGVKGKVLDSLAAGIPCVCTPAAAEGLDLPQILLDLVGATPSDLARSIRALHNDEALNRSCSEAGLAYLQSRCSDASVDTLLANAIGAPRDGPPQARDQGSADQAVE